ncbi:hypothetical protein [Streptomyces sp. MBT27]|uniref:hypothetical protein n=1 Tax=Streptomyces sp. MBT27 TaxID=1488356 RepID=UPI00142391D7|nr:hypothetical protein [Streptomyces sp. MBT27]
MTAGTLKFTSVYPVGDMAGEGAPDRRYSSQLIEDVAAVLERHGYPPVVAGPDYAALSMHLLRFCHLGR